MSYVAYNVLNLIKSPVVREFELGPVNDYHKSYYGKARVKQHKNGLLELISYTSRVALILPNGKYVSGGRYSATTDRHQKEFYDQFAKREEFKKLILRCLTPRILIK